MQIFFIFGYGEATKIAMTSFLLSIFVISGRLRGALFELWFITVSKQCEFFLVRNFQQGWPPTYPKKCHKHTCGRKNWGAYFLITVRNQNFLSNKFCANTLFSDDFYLETGHYNYRTCLGHRYIDTLAGFMLSLL